MGGGIGFLTFTCQRGSLAEREQFRARRGTRDSPAGDEGFRARRGTGNPHSVWGTVGPTISFLERDGAAWRYQRKIAGAQKLFCPPEAKMRPGTPPSLLGCALTEPKSPF